MVIFADLQYYLYAEVGGWVIEPNKGQKHFELIYGCYVVSGSNFLVTNHKECKYLIKCDLRIFTAYKNVNSQCYASSAFLPLDIFMTSFVHFFIK